MHAAGIIAHHPAKSAAAMCGRVGAKCQFVLFRLLAQDVEHHARLYSRKPSFRVDPENFVVVLGHVHDYRDIACLSGKACASAAGDNRCAELSAGRDSVYYVLPGFGYHHPDRYLPVI